MGYQNFDFKYRYLYPLMGLVLYYFLTIMIILTLNRYFKMAELNILTYLLIFFFLFESVIRFNAGLNLKLPKFIFVVEAVLFYLLLMFTAGGPHNFRDWGIWIVWAVGISVWFHVNDLTAYFNIFRVDCEKVFKKSSDRWSFDEFRRLLDYPSTWKKVSKKITLLNIPLLLIWAAYREYSLLVVTGTIIFLSIEIFLLALAYLDKKIIDWYIEGVESPLMLKKGWYSFLIIILIAALSFAAVLPDDYSPLPLQTIGSWLNSLLPQMNPEMPIDERPDVPVQIEETNRQEKVDGLNYFQLIFFILQIILFILISLLIIIFIVFLLKLEFKNIKNLPDFFSRFFRFFRSFIKELFSRVKELNFTIRTNSCEIKRKRQRKKGLKREVSGIKNIALPTNLRSMIIVIYNSMLKLLSIRGYGRRKDYTPYEYNRMLGDKFVDIKKEINQITDIYVEVIYSDHSFIKSSTRLVKGLWEKVKKVL